MLFHVETRSWRVALAATTLMFCEACNGFLELDRYTLQADAEVGPIACSTDAVCQSSSTAAICSAQKKQCVPVLDELCTELAGDISNPMALRLGALLSLHGQQLAVNRERQRGLVLAVEQINEAGGVPDSWIGIAHPLALVTCDSADDPVRAGRHLIDDLDVPAIIGPNSSDDVLDLATRLSIYKRTLTMSPTAMASSLRDLADNDLSWSMVPTDTQRGPLMRAQIKALERVLRRSASEPVKLSVLHRDDSYGHGVRLSLSSLTINELPLSHPDNLASAVQIAMYSPGLDDVQSLIASQLTFKPDIIVLAGTAEAVNALMAPLEERLRAITAQLPHYVLTDATKVSELLQLAQRYPDLAERVHGVGSVASDDFAWSTFERAYRGRFTDPQPQLAGVAAAYDSVYALSFAAAAAGGTVEGPDIAVGLRGLEGETSIDAPADLANAFKELKRATPGSYLVAHGAQSPFSWDERGAPRKGKLEVWCVAADAQSFVSGGVTLELGSDAPELHWENARACAMSQADQPAEAIATPATAVGTPDLQPPPAAAAPSQLPEDADADAGVPEPELPELYAEYRSANSNPIDALIGPWVRVGNRGTGRGVPLSELKLRYYVTNESNPLCVRDCIAQLYWAGLLPGGARIAAKLEYVTSGWLTGYLELSFLPDATVLRPDQYVEAQLEFHTADYQQLDETNDFSFDQAHRDFAEFRRVAVYRGDQLVWGEVPIW
jgi:ABC-type branched-subunit amino acid transport system substrate-binding protein